MQSSKSINEFISQKIKAKRIQAGFTQEQFAEKIGVTPQHFSCIELGKSLPSLPVFFNIAEILNLKLEDFGVAGQKNEKLNDFLRLLSMLDDTELECVCSIVQNLIKNFELLKTRKNKKRC